MKSAQSKLWVALATLLVWAPSFLEVTGHTSLGFGYHKMKEFRGHGAHITYHRPKSPDDGDISDEELNFKGTNETAERYFDHAILDHFAPISQRKFWSQRYFINDEFWGGQGYPVFLMVGGEGPMKASALSEKNFIYQLAEEHKALLVALEHRFYGKSYPTEDMSTTNLRYLTSEQALHDLATFHHFLTEELSLSAPLSAEVPLGSSTARAPEALPSPSGSKWIAFGGSYPGSLTAWFKLKFPQLVVGGIASSAPLLARNDFAEYMEVCGQALRYFGGGKCYHAVEEAMRALHHVAVEEKGGLQRLESMFDTCGPLQDQWDLAVLEQSVMGLFQDAVQYNGEEDKKMTVSDICEFMTKNENERGNVGEHSEKETEAKDGVSMHRADTRPSRTEKTQDGPRKVSSSSTSSEGFTHGAVERKPVEHVGTDDTVGQSRPLSQSSLEQTAMDFVAVGASSVSSRSPQHSRDRLRRDKDYMDSVAVDGHSTGQRIDRLAALSRKIQNGTCLDSQFDGGPGSKTTVGQLLNVTFDGKKSSRQWFYQTCNEFGFFQTTTSARSPFYPLKSLSLRATGSEVCNRVFGIRVQPDIEGINLNYGALSIRGENITFPNGSLDPWHVLGLTNSSQPVSASEQVVFIEGTPHCRDMKGPRDDDLPQIRWAHNKIAAAVRTYLS